MAGDVVIKRDPLKTKSKILEKATECFAKDDFHGTSLSAILNKAKVNKRMIYHYFGNKQALYEAVHLAQWKKLEEWILAIEDRPVPSQSSLEDAKENVLRIIQIYQLFIAENPKFLKLMIWDGIEGGRVAKKLWSPIRQPVYERIKRFVVKAQEQGVFPSYLDPNHLIISFMGAITFYFSHGHTLSDLFEKKMLTPESVLERNQQMLLLFQSLLGRG